MSVSVETLAIVKAWIDAVERKDVNVDITERDIENGIEYTFTQNGSVFGTINIPTGLPIRYQGNSVEIKEGDTWTPMHLDNFPI